MLASAHSPIFSTRSVRCAACLKGPPSGCSTRSWLGTACTGPLFATPSCNLKGPRSLPAGCLIHVGHTLLHPSHRLYEYRGFFFCTGCGALAAKFARALADPCPLAMGMIVRVPAQNAFRISRLFKGIHPYHKYLAGRPAVWPDVHTLKPLWRILAEAFERPTKAVRRAMLTFRG